MKLTIKYMKRNGAESLWKIDAESKASAERCFRMEHPKAEIVEVAEGFVNA